MKPIRKDLKRELWNLFCWVAMFRDPKIRIEGVQCSDDANELLLINDHVGFMYNFEIDDIKSIRGLNTLCCMWMNSDRRAKIDFNGKSIFDTEDLTTLNSG